MCSMGSVHVSVGVGVCAEEKEISNKPVGKQASQRDAKVGISCWIETETEITVCFDLSRLFLIAFRLPFRSGFHINRNCSLCLFLSMSSLLPP